MPLPKDLLTIGDLTLDHVQSIVATAFEFKETKDAFSAEKQVLKGKTFALIFEKNSLRTRVAFENAVASLGGHPIFLAGDNILYRADGDTSRESIEDITRNLDRLASGVAARVNSHKTLVDIAAVSKNPLINLLCDQHHPTQALADVMTMEWHKSKQKLKVAFVGDGNNVATSLMDASLLVGHDFSIATPKGYEIPENHIAIANKAASVSGASVVFTTDPRQASADADVIYTDTFVSMGDEEESAQRAKDFEGYQITDELMSLAKQDAVFMHCLPAHRGDEVAASVIDGSQSVVFDQAECRLHIAKALLYLLYR